MGPPQSRTVRETIDAATQARHDRVTNEARQGPVTRVLHIIPTLQRGGAERMLTQLVTATRPSGSGIEHSVVALRETGPFAEEIENAGVPVEILGLQGWSTAAQTIYALASRISSSQPDIIQSWLYYSDLAALIARGLVRGPKPRLYWNIRCSTLDFAAYSPTLRRTAKLSARLSDRVDGIIVNSRAGVLAHEQLGYARDRFIVIPNGIDTARFRPDAEAGAAVRTELGIEPDQPLVAHLARVDPQKDHGALIAVAERLPDVMFLAAGRGTDRLDGPPNLLLLGDRADSAALLNAADVVLSTSAYGEGFPNVIAEGMACGKPAVSTDCGDAAVIVGETGTIVPTGDVSALVAAVAAVFELDASERHARGTIASMRIVSEFALPRIIEGYDALYENGAIASRL